MAESRIQFERTPEGNYLLDRSKNALERNKYQLRIDYETNTIYVLDPLQRMEPSR